MVFLAQKMEPKSCRYLTDLQWRIVNGSNIYVYRNGLEELDPVLVHVPPSHKTTMKDVLTVIHDRVKFPVGFAHILYDMNGKRIRQPYELQMYKSYVVATNLNKRFRNLDYINGRGKFLVLNKDSRHIRVLRLMYHDFDDRVARKKQATQTQKKVFLKRKPQLEVPTAVEDDKKVEEPPSIPADFCPVDLAKRIDKSKSHRPRTRSSRRHGVPKQDIAILDYPTEVVVNNCTVVHTQPSRPFSRQCQNPMGQEYQKQVIVRYEDACTQYRFGEDYTPVTLTGKPFSAQDLSDKKFKPAKFLDNMEEYADVCDRGTSPLERMEPFRLRPAIRTQTRIFDPKQAQSYLSPEYLCPAFTRPGEYDKKEAEVQDRFQVASCKLPEFFRHKQN